MIKLLLLLLLPLSGFCQQDSIYVGRRHPLHIDVRGYQCHELKVSTDNGVLTGTTNPCEYALEAYSKSIATVSIRSKKDNKLLETRKFPVGILPYPIGTVAGKNGGRISANQLRTQKGIVVIYPNVRIKCDLIVVAFTAAVSRGSQIVFSGNCSSPYFSKEISDAFNMVRSGDKVKFSNIRCHGPNTRARTLQPIEFTIIE